MGDCVYLAFSVNGMKFYNDMSMNLQFCIVGISLTAFHFIFGFLIIILVIVRLDALLLPTHDTIRHEHNSLEVLYYFLTSFSLGL